MVDVGYLSLTKDRKMVSITVKQVRYLVSLEEVRAVLDGKLNFVEIFDSSL